MSSESTESGEDSEADTENSPRARMAAALQDVRREGWKAAAIYAAVDATALFLAVNLLFVLADPGVVPGVALPSPVTDALGGLLGRSLPVVTVPGSALLAIAVGAVVFGVELALRVRRPLVEQFEAANPAVAEALRTARDAVDRDYDSRMAARLYEDVLERLRESSGVALVDTRRIAGTLLIVVVLSLASVQLAAVDLDAFGGSDPVDGPGSEGENPGGYTGLEDGDAVLGDREEVESGDDELEAGIDSSGGREEVDGSQQFPSDSFDRGSGSSGGTDSQQAGFADAEQLEDADLIREYNLRIRTEENT